MAYGSVIGLSKAIDFLTNIGIEKIYSHNLSLVDILVKELRSRGGSILLKDAVSQQT
jgi:selenocysteine lyase/cysteine desulfurase